MDTMTMVRSLLCAVAVGRDYGYELLYNYSFCTKVWS